MAKVSDIRKLLQRCEVNGLTGKRTEQDMSNLIDEWLKTLGGCNAKLLDKALTEYLSSDSGKYARMPKTGELKQIYFNLLEAQQRKRSWDYTGKCPLCLDKGHVLVDAAEPFYGNYGSLGIVCPCRKSGEMQALEQGLRVTRRVKPGYLEIWLDRGRILGRLKVFEKKEPPAVIPTKAEPPRQQSIKPAFDDLPF